LTLSEKLSRPIVRFALAPAAPVSAGARQDHVTVIFNVFEELRRITANR
jgi:hypothetical protein